MWPIFLSGGGYELRSAAVFSGLGALAALLYARSRREHRGISLEDFWGLMLVLLLGLLVGGVGVHIVLYGMGPVANLERLLQSRVSGGSFFGVFWGAAAAGFLFCRSKRLAFSPIADDLGAAAALGLAIMRVGCLFNGCWGWRGDRLSTNRASSSQEGCGKKSFSSSAAGVIQLRLPTTTGGASRSSKQSCDKLAATVCMKQPRSAASVPRSTAPVFLTDSAIIV